MTFSTAIVGLLLILLAKPFRAENDKCNSDVVKKSKLNRITSLLDELKKHSDTINCLFDTSNKLQKSGGGGAVYVRWGRTTCPGNGTEMMYEGYTAGAWFDRGSAANFLCLPKIPSWGVYHNGYDKWTERVYGTEYEIPFHVGETFDTKYRDQDVPCAVCHSTARSAVYMIPGRKQCYSGWHMEYTGYLMADHYDHKPSEYICVDRSPETVHGGQPNKNGKVLYPVEAACGSLKCPPYVAGRELTCTVCTK